MKVNTTSNREPGRNPALMALRIAGVRRLWLVTMLGAVAFESLNVALIWIVVDDAGYRGAIWLSAVILITMMSALLGNGLLDHWRPFRVLACLDGIRAVGAILVAVLTVVEMPIGAVVAGATFVMIARPHIDAAAYGGIARVVETPLEQNGANILIDATFRLARIAGPVIAASMGAFFGGVLVVMLAAVCFVMATMFALSLPDKSGAASNDSGVTVLRSELKLFPKTGQISRFLKFAFISQAINAGVWYVGFTIGMAIFLTEQNMFSTFSLVVLFYGLGNVASNALYSLWDDFNPVYSLVFARGVAGLGYLFLSMTGGDLYFMILFAFVAACGTPPADLSFLQYIQARYPWRLVSSLCRMKLVCEYGGMLVAVLMGALIFRIFEPLQVVALCGAIMMLLMLWGVFYVKRPEPRA